MKGHVRNKSRNIEICVSKFLASSAMRNVGAPFGSIEVYLREGPRGALGSGVNAEQGVGKDNGVGSLMRGQDLQQSATGLRRGEAAWATHQLGAGTLVTTHRSSIRRYNRTLCASPNISVSKPIA